MTKQPGPLMDFNDQPQQRLYAVPDIPYELFDEKIEFREVGHSGVPKKIPSRAKFVIQVEWAWTPMHNRLTNYHISLDSERKRWVLWESILDDHSIPWRWNTVEEVHLVQRSGLSREAAAMILMKAAWENDRDNEMIDHYHWINGTGVIEVGTASEIAKAVWEEGA